MQPSTSNGDPNEPALSFHHASLKVQWANKNLLNLTNLINSFIEHEVKAKLVEPSGQVGSVLLSGVNIPPEFALIAGDIIFSLRSALDCCWMGLKRAADAGASKGTFPRADTRKEVIGTLGNASIETSFQGSDAFVTDKIKAYKDGNEILWFIAQVDNWNKHNMLNLLIGQTEVRSFSGSAQSVSGRIKIGKIVIKDSNFENGGIDRLIRLSEPLTFVSHNKPEVCFEILLKSSKPVDTRPLIPFLHSALKETQKAVELFFSTFGQ